MSKIEIGTKVRFKNDPSIRGIVQSMPDDNGDFEVEYQYGVDICQEDEVDILTEEFLEQEKNFLKELQVKVDDAAHAFEAAFRAFQEVNKMADEHSCLLSLEQEKLIDTSYLEEVVSNGGWSTSSLFC